MSDAAIHCRDLRKHYPDVKAVDGLDLYIARGECFVDGRDWFDGEPMRAHTPRDNATLTP